MRRKILGELSWFLGIGVQKIMIKTSNLAIRLIVLAAATTLIGACGRSGPDTATVKPAASAEDRAFDCLAEVKAEFAANPATRGSKFVEGASVSCENGYVTICLLYTSPSPRDRG